VVIEEISEVNYLWRGHQLECSVRADVINKSATGPGEIRDIVLRIFFDDNTLDVLPMVGTNIIGFRIQPYGRYPERRLDFVSSPINPDMYTTIAGREAELILRVIGQKTKRYRTRMAQQ
jgi:hypothetical protein